MAGDKASPPTTKIPAAQWRPWPSNWRPSSSRWAGVILTRPQRWGWLSKVCSASISWCGGSSVTAPPQSNGVYKLVMVASNDRDDETMEPACGA